MRTFREILIEDKSQLITAAVKPLTLHIRDTVRFDGWDQAISNARRTVEKAANDVATQSDSAEMRAALKRIFR